MHLQSLTTLMKANRAVSSDVVSGTILIIGTIVSRLLTACNGSKDRPTERLKIRSSSSDMNSPSYRVVNVPSF